MFVGGHQSLKTWVCCSAIAWAATAAMRPVTAQQPVWERHAIDDTLRGADGVRLADANGDGRPDIATGWEESGETRVYLHPGTERVTLPWPAVSVGSSPSVEDAVWVDLSGDGQLDVLSSCEGKEQSLRLHTAPSRSADLLKPEAWTTMIVPTSVGATRWMYALPFPSPARDLASAQVDFLLDDLILGSKAPSAMVGLLHKSPKGSANDRDRDSPLWSITRLCSAEWIMSLEKLDVNRDGKPDVVYSDRKGKRSGVYWLENPGRAGPWPQHLIGGLGSEVMFLQVVPNSAADVQAKADDVLESRTPPRQLAVAVKPRHIFVLTAGDDCRAPWNVQQIDVEPADRIGTAKSVAVADLTGDGRPEFVFSCEAADGNRSGVVYLSATADGQTWELHDVSGPQGMKFDRLELVDLDNDSDLDILTCEERFGGKGLGVIWYANPMSQKQLNRRAKN